MWGQRNISPTHAVGEVASAVPQANGEAPPLPHRRAHTPLPHATSPSPYPAANGEVGTDSPADAVKAEPPMQATPLVRCCGGRSSVCLCVGAVYVCSPLTLDRPAADRPCVGLHIRMTRSRSPGCLRRLRRWRCGLRNSMLRSSTPLGSRLRGRQHRWAIMAQQACAAECISFAELRYNQ